MFTKEHNFFATLKDQGTYSKMPKINAINATSAINYGPTISTRRDGGDNSGDFIASRLNYLYNQTLAVSRNSSLNFRGLKKIVQKGAGEKLDKVV